MVLATKVDTGTENRGPRPSVIRGKVSRTENASCLSHRCEPWLPREGEVRRDLRRSAVGELRGLLGRGAYAAPVLVCGQQAAVRQAVRLCLN
eukprot:COSAG04_NODE_91_length_26852_cov_8.609315_6_plen_92_part_00